MPQSSGRFPEALITFPTNRNCERSTEPEAQQHSRLGEDHFSTKQKSSPSSSGKIRVGSSRLLLSLTALHSQRVLSAVLEESSYNQIPFSNTERKL
ncbi:unnamed protein product [Enterobius vermicularis]|uniref:Uncharacterized protein n=1 Tax=Enterobius vermicularis TaxID=51028 RepID=A0A0N4VA22_ENTVE|nr:unnamed protein product [Enterobius vermicularis]